MLTLAIAITMTITSAFAGEESVTPQILNAFKSEFVTAREVEWTISENYYRADFTLNDQKVFAYYNTDGQFLGLTRFISTTQLPITLQTSLKKNYDSYWITDLFEVANEEGTAYYITLENTASKIVLKSNERTSWSMYQKSKKI